VALGCGLAGIAGQHIQWVQPLGSPLMVRLIQPATPQSEKFDPRLFETAIDQSLRLADLPVKGESTALSLIVFPETVMPIFQDEIPAAIWSRWQALAQRQQATLLMGIPLHQRTADGDRYTNGAIALPPDDTSFPRTPAPWHYDKHHLVPFGEFIPPGFRWFVDALQIPLGDFNRGPLIQPPLRLSGQSIAVDICYEDAFGEQIAAQVAPPPDGAGASILVNISNLAWFGNSWALRQHLWMARMRALETARPLVAATNTGMTVALDPYGQVRGSLDPGIPGVLDVEVLGTQGLTPYVRWRNAPVLAWLGLWLIVGFWRKAGRRRQGR
jgi:apolipoprotein N-acyltransferase